MAVTCSSKVRPYFAVTNLLFSLALFCIACGTISAAIDLNMDRLFSSPGPLKDHSDSLFVAMTIGALTLILVSLLGCSTFKISARVLPLCQGLLLFPTFLIYVTCAGMFGRLMLDHGKGLESFCDSETHQNGKFTGLFEPYVTQIDNTLVPVANKWMCSQQCACSQDDASIYLNLDPSVRREFDRRTAITDVKDDPEAEVLVYLDPQTNTDQVIYTTFADCFYEWRSDWEREGSQTGVAPTGWTQVAQADFEALESAFTSTDLAEYLAVTQECNGICEQGFFAFALPITKGPPRRTCSKVIADSFKPTGSAVYAWLILGSVFTIFAWLAHFSLVCFTFKQKTRAAAYSVL